LRNLNGKRQRIFYNKLIEVIGGWLLVIAIIGGVYWIGWGYPAHLVRKHLAEGWVAPMGWDCPPDHPIKANLKSMIYHIPGDPYWSKTDAMSGECFDSAANAIKQGFRASRGTPLGNTGVINITSAYNGGYAPDGTFCDYGYNPDTQACCDDDDYTCEVRDQALQELLLIVWTEHIVRSNSLTAHAHITVE